MSKNYSDKELKDQGNKLFASRNYDGAIECYTKAILKNPSVPHYYTNRALCYLNQKRWPQAIQDSKLALEKEPNLVKGHFYLGEFLFTSLTYVDTYFWYKVIVSTGTVNFVENT